LISITKENSSNSIQEPEEEAWAKEAPMEQIFPLQISELAKQAHDACMTHGSEIHTYSNLKRYFTP